MSSFLSFLQSECTIIPILIEEFKFLPAESIEEEQLKNQFAFLFDENLLNQYEWWRMQSVRAAISKHFETFDFNISLLIEVIDRHKFVLEIEEMVEMIRMLDILGAECKLKEYGILLIEQLQEKGKYKSWKEYESTRKLPISFETYLIEIQQQYRKNRVNYLCSFGSQEFLEYYYYAKHIQTVRPDEIFRYLCIHNRLSLAQWFYFEKVLSITPLILLIPWATYQIIFDHTSQYGYFELMQWVYHLEGSKLEYTNAFQLACQYGHLEIAQWLYRQESNRIKLHDSDELAFQNACQSGSMPLVQWLYNLAVIDHHAANDTAFIKACGGGWLEIAQWLYRLDKTISYPLAILSMAFRYACSTGHINVVRWLYELTPEIKETFEGKENNQEDYHFNLIHSVGMNPFLNKVTDAFQGACAGGHFSIVQWLIELGASLHAHEDQAFIFACSNGHLNLAQWLYDFNKDHDQVNETEIESVRNIITQKIIDQAFQKTCQRGHLEVVQWLSSLSKKGINLYCYDDNLFASICQNGHLEVAQWIYHHGCINVEENGFASFRFALEQGHVSVVKWLYSLSLVGYEFVEFEIEGHEVDEEIYEWYQSLSY
jgi:hypothetical protein